MNSRKGEKSIMRQFFSQAWQAVKTYCKRVDLYLVFLSVELGDSRATDGT